MSKDCKQDEQQYAIPVVSGSAFDKTKELLKKLTDDERMELLGDYCKYCGDVDPSCQCWNDE